jgi:hypothetical protein
MSKINRVQLNRMQRDLKRALTTIEAWQPDSRQAPKRVVVPRGPNSITRVEVVGLVRQLGHPVTAEMVRLELQRRRGKRPKISAVNSHIHSALARKELVKLSRGLFEAAPLANGVAESMQ